MKKDAQCKNVRPCNVSYIIANNSSTCQLVN